MITSISRIKGLGVFADFSKPGDLHEFEQYNLFYGWNGSGKSTLSKLFRSLEKRLSPEGYENPYFELTINSEKYTSKNLADFKDKILVFNQDFINENINWNETVKSILLISEEKIEERKQLELLKLEEASLQKSIVDIKAKIENYTNDMDKFLTSTAKNIKESFRILDAKDTYYLNYNKTKLSQFINDNKEKLKLESCRLKDEDIKLVTDAIKPEIKEKIPITINYIQQTQITEIKNRVLGLLTTNIVSKSIERLKDNSDISSWVEQGLGIHKKHDSKLCEFCGNELPEKRIKDLEEHFNDNFKELKQKLETAKEWLGTKKPTISELPDKIKLYDEFQAAYLICKEKLSVACSKVNEVIDNWILDLQKKTDNPFEVKETIADFNDILINHFNEQLKQLQEIVDKHNNKTDNFEKEIQRQKKKLELHYSYDAITEFDFFEKTRKNDQQEIDKGKLLEQEKNLMKQIDELEKLLSNEVLGASKFNEKLSKFLGHKDIVLVFDETEKGYRIIRNHSKQKAVNLSEGEKTAIAFVYFITKLKENGNVLNDSIVVIDDPISSFDSNHLFHAYSFLKNECETANQIFILTHNFIFFRLVRDWLIKKNKKEKIRTRIYSIEIIPGEIRKAEIKNANVTLVDYQSEYHYLFQKVFNYREQSNLTLDEAFLVANLSRKLLEGFLNFKFPKKRNDFNQLVEVAIKDTIKKEQIYRFINKYSHNTIIDIGDNSIDNLLGESPNIVKDILNVIEELDQVHYREMEDLICANCQ